MGKESINLVIWKGQCVVMSRILQVQEAGCAVGGCDGRKLVGSIEVVMSLPGR